MGKITIFNGDQELLHGIDVDMIADAVADYVNTYDQIAKALHAGGSLRVAVSNSSVAAWLSRMQERYSNQRIEIREVTLRGRLAEQLQLEIPDWVTDNQIQQAKLLDIHISAVPGREFEDFILEIFFSPFMARPSLPLTQLDDLVSSYDPEQWTQNEKKPILRTVLQRRLSKWEDKTRLDGEKLLIKWLRRDPSYLGEQMTILKAVEGYGAKIGQRIFGDDFGLLRDLELDLTSIEVDETGVSSVLDQIQIYLQQVRESLEPKEVLNALLEQASGHLEIEFDAVQSLLRSGELIIDANVVNRVRKLFAPIRNRPHLDQALADLDLLISRERPPDTQEHWDEEVWIDWAVSQYLPYRYWLEEIGQLTDDVTDLADAYAEWLYHHYPAARLNSKKMIHQALPSLRPTILEEAAVLILVLDNFNTKFLRDFRRYMQEAGFYNQDTNYYISMLPSATEVSKKCLITGQPTPFKNTAYEGPVKEVWGSALKGKRVRYLPHIGALRDIKQREDDVYFLNYLPLDIAFHQDEQQTGISHAQAVRGYLRALAEDVRAFSERIGVERELLVITLSDHGSTRIPAEEPNPIDPSFFAKRVEDKHHRYVSINDEELAGLSDNVQFQCYLFERDKFDLDTNYMAARRHYRFLPTTESIYVHGGLTPEETIVPVAIFKPVRVTPKPIQVTLLNKEFYYGRRSELRFELVNTNAYTCESVSLEIMNLSVEAPVVHVGDLATMSQQELSVDGRFRRGREDLHTLEIRLTYEFLGEPQQQSNEVSVEMKKIIEHTFDLSEFL